MKDRLRDILLKKSVITGKTFTLASGKTSDFYVDARMTTFDAEGAYLCGALFFRLLQSYQIDAVGGYAIGADPIVASIAVISYQEKKPLPAFIIRKDRKTHGTRRAVEGNFPESGRVAIVDDVITSGGSILRGAEQVKSLGCQVSVVLALVDRQEGAREAIESAGYPLVSIFSREDLS